MTIPWAQNDALFKKELEEGQLWQNHVGNFLRLSGLDVYIPPLTIRESIAEAGEWIDSKDLVVRGSAIGDQIVEVKARNERFTSPESFPYDTIFVDTVSGYDAKKTKPIAYVNISKKTGSMIALPSTSSAGWLTENRFDHVRKIRDDFYLAPKKKFHVIDILVERLRKI